MTIAAGMTRKLDRRIAIKSVTHSELLDELHIGRISPIESGAKENRAESEHNGGDRPYREKSGQLGLCVLAEDGDRAH